MSDSTFCENDLDNSAGLNTAHYLSQIDSCTSVASTCDSKMSKPFATCSVSDMEVTVTLTISEMQELKARCSKLETSKKSLEERVEALEAEKMALEKSLSDYISESKVKTK